MRPKSSSPFANWARPGSRLRHLPGRGAAGTARGNGIGAFEGHGANVAQLDGYENILYLSGTLNDLAVVGHRTRALVQRQGRRPGADLRLVARCRAPGASPTSGTRFAHACSSVSLRAREPAWVWSGLGRGRARRHRRPVRPARRAGRGHRSTTEFVAQGGCFSIADFDHLQPDRYRPTCPGVPRQHGCPIPGPAAAVMKDRGRTGSTSMFPIAFHRIENAVRAAGSCRAHGRCSCRNSSSCRSTASPIPARARSRSASRSS